MRLVARKKAVRAVQAVVLVVADKTPIPGLVACNEHDGVTRPVPQQQLTMSYKDLTAK